MNTPAAFPPDSIVVTIDGPAGAGKSSVAKRLAAALEFDYLDTGAMYRCVTYAALSRGVDLRDQDSVLRLANSLKVDFSAHQVLLDGSDVSNEIRNPVISESVGLVADNVSVRKLLCQWQRQLASGRRMVTDGRDQGSEVFVDSPCKIFLVASSHERARRRQLQLASKGFAMELDTIVQQQEQRDLQDRTRPVGKLQKAADSIEFSTDGLTLDQVVHDLEQIVRARLSRLGFPWQSPEDRNVGDPLQVSD